MSVDAFLEMFGPRETYEPRDPMKSAQLSMRNALPKRFYQDVALELRDGAYQLLLDGKPAKTPSRKPLAVAPEVVALVLAQEWRTQVEVIDPARMPLTRLINVAIDHVDAAREAIIAETAKYAQTDLLAYRASDPSNLVAQQGACWNPLLALADARYGARLQLAEGIVFVEQSPETRAALANAITATKGSLQLAALNVVTTLTGSLVLALLLRDGAIAPDEAWNAAHLDEDFQIAVWGQDDEAVARRAFRRAEFDASTLVLAHLQAA
jgi:chaperone required for assembly of F1-ATPase